jgi:UDP-N-acetylmuramate: L-alanyl-gamma-D-glutamyl-meso-diaminopimelate ligase
VGGLPQWNPRGFRLGDGRWLVIEGDEYNTAFFDRGPKFLHYRPHLFILGPVEFDHADLFPDLNAVLTAFRAGAAQVPRDGAVVVNGWSEGALAACRDATAPLLTVGEAADADLRLVSWEGGSENSRALLCWQGSEIEMKLPQPGLHNIQNAAVAVAAAAAAGVDPAAGAGAMASFPGVARRMEIVGDAAGVVVVDDFAHHPTALAATIAAARQRWPERRLVVAFEPRSLTAARRSFHEAYLKALGAADLVLVAPPYHRGRFREDEVLDRGALAEALAARGVRSVMPEPGDDPVAELLPAISRGDVVLGCSSGDFGGFSRRLAAALEQEEG